MYGDDVMSATVKGFSTITFKVAELFLNRTGKKRGVWIIAAGFCCVRFINNSHYLLGDKSIAIRRRAQPQESNVPFVQLPSTDSATKLKDDRIFAVR